MMRHRIKRSTLALMAGLASAPVLAEDAVLSASLARPEIKAAVTEAIRAQMHDLPELCQAMRLHPVDRLVVEAPSFRPDGSLAAGTVKETWSGQGCGRETRLNLWTIAASGGPRVLAALPGTSLASLRLQQDTLALAAATAGAADIVATDCKATRVVDTAFRDFEGEPVATVGGQQTRPWREEWTLTGCGRWGIVTIHFVPDASGTGMRMPSSEARRIEAPAR